jgi:crotonobetainyl-CoA:carnitine CoA-transferase CaiB-like acyl-CoA transferase
MDGEERFLHTPAFVDAGLVAEYHHPLWGLMREIGSVINFSETPGRIFGPPSRLGQHTYEIMSDLGYGDEEVKRLEGEGVIYASPKS